MSGTRGEEPVATTSSANSSSRPATSTTPGPAIVASPRTSSAPCSASQFACHESSRPLVTWSRHEKIRAGSSSPVTASAAPGARRAAASASPERRSVFVGMQA
jgi:hypothetical protein